MSRYVFDIETNGLLDTVDTMWILYLRDLDSDEEYYFLEGDVSWKETLDQAEHLVGHNIIGYDLEVLLKLFGWTPGDHTVIHDTLVMSKAQNFRRFANGRHRLEEWGIFLKYPKMDHNQWDRYSPKMLKYCRRDVRLTLKIYNYLLKEFEYIVGRNPFFKLSMQNEHLVDQFCTVAEREGWPFNKEKAEALLEKAQVFLEETKEKIEPLLSKKIKQKDKVNGENDWKEPKFTKKGHYTVATVKWFGLEPEDGLLEIRPIEGPYSRIEIVNQTVKNMSAIKELLFSLGWQPLLWNYVIEADGTKRQTSPKLCPDSLKAVGPIGEMIDEYMTVKSRFGIITGWIRQLVNGRVHGSINSIGTPTGRATHSVIVNVPKVGTPWGKEMRDLFEVMPGNKLVGCDSSGNQLRAFCFYLKDEGYTQEVIKGDVHQRHANIINDILREIKINKVITRNDSKPFLYAYLFGGGAPKLALIITGRADKNVGNVLKREFAKRIPGLAELNKKISSIYFSTEKTGKPWIPGIDGRKIYCDSAHKALNYELQDFEAISVKSSIAYIMRKCKEEGLKIGEHYHPRIFMHDEVQIEVAEEHAERLKAICEEAFTESAKDFGINILEGKGSIGNSWYETH